MKRFELARVLKKEGLKYYNLFNEHEIKPNEVIIYEKDNKWQAALSDS